MDLGLWICSFLFPFVTFFLFSFAFDGKSLMQFVFHCPIRRGHKMIISLKPGSIMVLIFDGFMMVCRKGFYSPCGISAPAIHADGSSCLDSRDWWIPHPAGGKHPFWKLSLFGWCDSKEPEVWVSLIGIRSWSGWTTTLLSLVPFNAPFSEISWLYLRSEKW